MSERPVPDTDPMLRRWTADASGSQTVRADWRPQVVLIALCLASIVSLWIGIVAFVQIRERAALVQVQSQAQNLAIALDEQVQRTVQGVDQMMRFTIEEVEENRAAFNLKSWLARGPEVPDVVMQVALVDAKGDVTSNLDDRPGGINIADREHFQVHADNPQAGLFISRPMIERRSGKWSIQLSRRINGLHGVFAGVLVMSVDPFAIGRIFSNIDVGPGGSVTLLGSDGFVRARTPALEGMFERNIGQTPSTRAMLQTLATRRSGIVRLVSPLDGIERMTGFRTISDLPLVVAVGASTAAVLDPIRQERVWIISGGGIITAVLLIAFGLLFRLLEVRRRKEMELAWANRALAEGEARYRLLADNATDAIARIGLDLTFKYLSPAIKAIRGYEPEELIGRDSLESVHPDDRGRVIEYLGNLIAAGPGAARRSLEFRGQHKDGRQVWYEINPTVVFDLKTDAPIEIVDVIRDVTPRKAVEKELRAKSKLVETTLENMDQGLMMIDAEGRVVVCNQRAIDLMGYPAELMSRQPHFREVRRYLAENGEFSRSNIDVRRWVEEEGLIPEQLFFEHIRPNGTVVEIRTVPLEGGGVVRTYTDITARRKAERAERESEERYRLLAENASDTIILQVVGGPLRYVSPACLPMLGYMPEELLDIRFETLIHPDDHARVVETCDQLSPSCTQIRDIYRLRHKQGRWVWVEGAFRLMDAGVEPMVLASLRDVTDRQIQAEELKAAKETAEDLVQKAQAASNAKTDFLASMSHEIRTPLNSIIGFTNLVLESEGLTAEQRRQIEQVRGSGQALLTVVNDVLDFSKIEAGQVDLDPQPFALKALLDNAVSIVRGIAIERHIPIHLRLEPGLPVNVIGDADRLRQILLNLLNNAVKFTPQGEVILAVRRTGKGLHFAVTDTGIGIPQDKLPRLFGRFTQVDNSIRRQFGGTGLGLAICKHLVTLMGGEIGVSSREGEGSTFWFEVKLSESAAPAPLADTLPRETQGQPADILLVEDVDINQELAQLILEKAGHRVDVASNGAEAVEAVRRKRYDLVLMDVQMPIMDGITATGRIRSMGGHSASMPIIAMTANVLPDQISRFKQAGMDDHVGKPFQAAALLATIVRWTGRSRLDEAS